MPVGQGDPGTALQQVLTSPVLLATVTGMLLRILRLPIPPTVSTDTPLKTKWPLTSVARIIFVTFDIAAVHHQSFTTLQVCLCGQVWAGKSQEPD